MRDRVNAESGDEEHLERAAADDGTDTHVAGMPVVREQLQARDEDGRKHLADRGEADVCDEGVPRPHVQRAPAALSQLVQRVRSYKISSIEISNMVREYFPAIVGSRQPNHSPGKHFLWIDILLLSSRR